MRTIITIILALCLATTINAQEKIEIQDLKVLNNTSWKGTLMYKDYTSGKKRVLKTTMQVAIKKNKFITDIQFTYEPDANSRETIKIKKGGTYFGSERIIKKEMKDDGSIKFITSFKGKDNNKKANMYKTYFFSADEISITKEVQYIDSKERFIRNKQSYKRI